MRAPTESDNALVTSVLKTDVVGRAVLGACVSALLVGVVAVIVWVRVKGKHRFWFKPLLMRRGLAAPLWRLRQSDYRWWALAAGIFLIWWLGACLIPNAVLLGQYSSAVSQA